MRYLIDGYNLLHAMGLLTGKVGPNGLEKARLSLLGRLRGAYGDSASCVTVVFDARGAPAGAAHEDDYQGIHVFYTLDREADDLIEELIRRDSAPRQLTVVSDDNRIRQAAARRQCRSLRCLDFVEETGRPRRAARPAGPGKPAEVSAEEAQRWLAEFAGLDDDPQLRDAFGKEFPFDVEE
jgi:predicted RNA-binding protein with PIN domain